MQIDVTNIPADQPVLIAGPTASGKSALALQIAARGGGVVINADALQVFENWRVLTARPNDQETALAPHALYGHVPGDAEYSVGHWLRDVTPLLQGPERPIIVGGTGLYFTALTEGLAQIPPTPIEIRATADARVAEEGHTALLPEIDAGTLGRIDTLNPMRVQRAWEVQTATGRGLAAWQDDTGPALLPLAQTRALVLTPERDWLTERIERRFDKMLANGALDEARANLDAWNPDHPSSKAIGALELISHLLGTLSLNDARTRAQISTRQYAKRQRTWFRSRMQDWEKINLP